jgi:hypothetical protein
MMIDKENSMGFEKRVLSVVAEVTDVPAAFYNGTLFLSTQDSKVATEVFDALYERITAAISFGKCGRFETSYDFL